MTTKEQELQERLNERHRKKEERKRKRVKDHRQQFSIASYGGYGLSTFGLRRKNG